MEIVGDPLNSKHGQYSCSFCDFGLEPNIFHLQFIDKPKALELAQGLMEKKFFNAVAGKGGFEEGSALFRLLEHDPNSALNTGEMAACSPMKGMYRKKEPQCFRQLELYSPPCSCANGQLKASI